MPRLSTVGRFFIGLLLALVGISYVFGTVSSPRAAVSTIRSLARPLRVSLNTAIQKQVALTPIAVPAAAPTMAFASGRDALQDPVITAAGDIACSPSAHPFNGGQGASKRCHMQATADLVLQINPTVALTLGDNQYPDGTLDDFQKSFDLSWGRFKPLIRPAPGNHEYHLAGAVGYYTYFGAVAGSPSQGYYSFDLGRWHLIALNSECSFVGGCTAVSPQALWLQQDLAANPGKCLLAYWHQPRFSSGPHGSNPTYTTFWQYLYAAHADLVLSGHDHLYERFNLQDANGQADPQGIRQFTVGTGGARLYPIQTIVPNSQVRHDKTFGVLKLTLHATSYDWEFVPEAGETFTDAGTTACHN